MFAIYVGNGWNSFPLKSQSDLLGSPQSQLQSSSRVFPLVRTARFPWTHLSEAWMHRAIRSFWKASCLELTTSRETLNLHKGARRRVLKPKTGRVPLNPSQLLPERHCPQRAIPCRQRLGEGPVPSAQPLPHFPSWVVRPPFYILAGEGFKQLPRAKVADCLHRRALHPALLTFWYIV